jgi:hypothetical protein
MRLKALLKLSGRSIAGNVLHCRSGGGFAQQIQTTTKARLFTTDENLFVCHHFGNAVVVRRFLSNYY